MISADLKEMNTKTGNVKFNQAGDRVETDFDIVNINSAQKVVTVGKWRPSMSQNALIFNENVSIEWSTGKKETPNGILLNKSLKVFSQSLFKISQFHLNSSKVPCSIAHATNEIPKDYYCKQVRR